MFKLIRALALVPSLALVLLVPANAAAANPMTVSAGNSSLAARVALTVPVTVSCPPFDPILTTQGLSLVQEYIAVNVEQASGRQIARGSSSLYSFPPGPWSFACDGGSTTINVMVLAIATCSDCLEVSGVAAEIGVEGCRRALQKDDLWLDALQDC